MTDSLLIVALGDTRQKLATIAGGADATSLRRRAGVLERAVAAVGLKRQPKDDVVHIARMILALREEAVELSGTHRAIGEALGEWMD